jgi:RimJ/RimL family protein N-acetyltransferase
VRVRALTSADAACIAAWRYPGRYSTYDVGDASVLARDHWAVTHAGRLYGYCCFGAPARARAAGAEPGTLDVGYGLAPEEMGRGQGERFVGAVLEFARERYDPERIRLFVLEWNKRSAKVAQRLGFGVERVVPSDEGPFLVMVRDERRGSRPRGSGWR